jgi:protein-histidine N-methyltransferase
VLTSETIYKSDSLDSLVKLVKAACGYLPCPLPKLDINGDLEELTEQKLSLRPPTEPHPRKYLCLVAAKVLYFGVGGGVSEFVRNVEGPGNGKVETVWEKKMGVATCVMRVRWDEA